MEVSTIVVAALLLGGLGLVFGGVLAIVSKVFSVPADPVFDAVREALPGANCGGCGFSGCDAYARAVAEGKAGVSQCPVGGAEAAKHSRGRDVPGRCGKVPPSLSVRWAGGLPQRAFGRRWGQGLPL